MKQMQRWKGLLGAGVLVALTGIGIWYFFASREQILPSSATVAVKNALPVQQKISSGRTPHAVASRVVAPGKATITRAGLAAAPQPSKAPGGEVIAYRVCVLPPTQKGEPEGELREWLIRPEEGYTTHLEEHWRPDEQGTPRLTLQREYVANQVLLTLDGMVDVEAFAQAMMAKGATKVDTLMSLAKGGRIVAVQVPEISFEAAANLLEVIRAWNGNLEPELEPVVTTSRLPNDSRMKLLWGMEQIEAPEAWELGVAATNVVVAVMDTGVNYHHEDLTENIGRDTEQLPFPWVKGYRSIGGNTSADPMDDNGHGTHCAGTIAARGENALGVAGVTWRTQLMPIKVLNNEGKGYTSDIIRGYVYARDHGAQVINCSFGGTMFSGAAETAIQQLRILGVTLACAAGNGDEYGNGLDNDTLPHYPSSYDVENVLAVASSSPADALSEFSNYGAMSVDLAAPGEDILSTCISFRNADTCYEVASGTSMATPHVTGALTLLKGRYPEDVYWQTMQRLTLNGDCVEAMKGKTVTGMRLNLRKAMESVIPPAPVVSATEGGYEDRVEVTWKPVGGATYYRLWRAWSEEPETKTLLMDWTTECSFVDRTAELKVGYYYTVQCAKATDGLNVSPHSPAAVGYLLTPVLDAWDPKDDVPTTATILTPTGETQVQGPHSLSRWDGTDWYRVEVTAGQTYRFESTGSADTIGELFVEPSETASRILADDDSGEETNFRSLYTPLTDGAVWLRVRQVEPLRDGYYQLQYALVGWDDAFDPADDTMAGASVLMPGETEERHGLHALSATDPYDLFKVELTAGVTYSFSSTGDTDTFGELFYGSLAQGNLAAWNDDGHLSGNGSPFNFRIVYTPSVSGTYYLKVKLAPSGGTTGTYHLAFFKQAEVLDFVFTADEVCQTVKGWQGEQPFVASSADAVKGGTLFTIAEPLYLKWAFNEAGANALAGRVTHLVEILNPEGVRLVWGHAVAEDLAADEFIDYTTELPPLPAGGYTARFTLNCDVDGVAAQPETARAENVRTIGFTVVDTADTIVALEITGAAEVAAKGTAPYTCVATFADGSTATVVPTWCVFEGPAEGTIDAAGLLTAGVVTEPTTLRLRAVLGGCLAFKTVTIVPTQALTENPFPEAIVYPSQPMVVKATAFVDGVRASTGDWVAAYAGAQVRGTAKVDAEGTVTVRVSVAQPGETITFKIWDASAGDEGAILACAQAIYGVPAYTYEDLELTATTEDPFGTPVVGGNKLNGWKPGTLYARVTINGQPAETGDILAVYDGERLVGKAMIVQTAVLGEGDPIATCKVTVNLSEKATLSFVVWDRSAQRRCGSSVQLEMHKNGDTLGSKADPVLIPADDRTQQTFVLAKPGWHPISFSVLPNPATPEAVFGEAPIKRVKPETERFEMGKGYWVQVTDHDVTWVVTGAEALDKTLTLEQGWNFIGYPLLRAGRIEDVLRDAVTEGKIVEIATQHAQWPQGGLTTLHPGVGYDVYAPAPCTIRWQSNGMLASTGGLSTYGPFGEGKMVVCDPVTPTIFSDVKVWYGDAPAAFGDCVALYDQQGNIRAVARVEQDDGTVTFPLYATEGTPLTAKFWSMATDDEVLAAQTNLSLVAPTPGSRVEGLILTVAAETLDTVTVTFDLGTQGTRCGGGELIQTFAPGNAAVAPLIEVAEGYCFDHWSEPFTDVRTNVTIRAIYRSQTEAPSLPEEVPTPPRKATLSFNSNGATGEMASVEVNFDQPSETLSPSTFEKEGERFIGWSTTPNGAIIIRDGATIGEIGAALGAITGEVPLYAQFAKDGFDVRLETYVLNAGKRVSVPINFNSAIPLSCINVRVTYDPKVLALVKVTEGSLATTFTDDFTVAEPELGTVSVALFAEADQIPGKGTVATLIFVAREGTDELFSDITISDVQLAEASGVKDVTVDKPVNVLSGMVRVMRPSAQVERLENEQIVVADTMLETLVLSAGDAIQASDAQTPVIVTGAVTAAERIPVCAPVNGWAGGRYALLQTPTEGLSFELEGVKEVAFTEERTAGVTTYYAQLPLAQDEIPVLSDDHLTAGTCNQIRDLLKDQLAGITEIRITGPQGLIGVIADMGIAPTCTTNGSILTAVYTMPTIAITHFNPKSGLIRIRVKPGEGNQIVSEIAMGYVHVYGADSLSETMQLLEKIGYDLTPYLKAETKGEAELKVSLGSATFLKVKVEANPVE